MAKVRELAIITAQIYRAGALVGGTELSEMENDLWDFRDPQATCIWDAVADENAVSTTFSTDALRVSIDPAPSPSYQRRYSSDEYTSNLERLLAKQLPDEAFATSAEALVLVAKRRFFDVEVDEVKFSGLFELEIENEYSETDEWIDAEIRATFLGELDFNQSLSSLTFTVTTAELEAQVLAAMRAYRVPMSVGLIADAVNVRHELIGDPILALDHAGLIVSNYSGERLTFSLTDRAKKGML